MSAQRFQQDLPCLFSPQGRFCWTSLWNGTKRDRCHRHGVKFGKNTTVTTNRINNQYDNMKMVKQGQFVLPHRGGVGVPGGARVGALGLQPGCMLLGAEAGRCQCGN